MRELKYCLYDQDTNETIDESWISSHSPKEIMEMLNKFIVQKMENEKRQQSIIDMYSLLR